MLKDVAESAQAKGQSVSHLFVSQTNNQQSCKRCVSGGSDLETQPEMFSVVGLVDLKTCWTTFVDDLKKKIVNVYGRAHDGSKDIVPITCPGRDLLIGR